MRPSAPCLIRSAVTSYNEWRAPKGIELGIAATEKVQALETVLRDFVPRVLGFDLDDCFITDESSLHDFTMNDEELPELRERISSAYGIDVQALPDERLVAIAAAIDSRNSLHAT